MPLDPDNLYGWPVKVDDPGGGGPAWATHEVAVVSVEAERMPPMRMIDPEGMTRLEAEALAAAAARALAKLDEQDSRFGIDGQDGAVIRFQIVHGVRTYSYAGLRAGGLWYLTGGQAPQAQTWDQLKAWLFHRGAQSVEVLAESWPLPAIEEDATVQAALDADLEQRRKRDPFASTAIEDAPTVEK